jgi:hypothetical protein
MGSIASGIMGGIGDLAKGAAEATAYQSNARQALRQTEVERQISYLKAAATERGVGQTIGTAQAQFGHAGIAPSLWLLSDAARQGEVARQMQLYQGRAGAAAQLREADVQHAQATAARTGSYLAAGGSLLAGLAGQAQAAGGPEAFANQIGNVAGSMF